MQEYKRRRKLPKSLEDKLASVKGFKLGWEGDRNYTEVLERLKNANPFSALVFYETPERKISLARKKKLNQNVPEEMLGKIASYVQFYFIPEFEEVHQGAWIGSGYRHTQTVYALALSLLSKKVDVPTHILVYDQQNRMKHILSSPTLIVQPHEVSQCVEKSAVKRILKNTKKAYGLYGYGKQRGKLSGVLVDEP